MIQLADRNGTGNGGRVDLDNFLYIMECADLIKVNLNKPDKNTEAAYAAMDVPPIN